MLLDSLAAMTYHCAFAFTAQTDNGVVEFKGLDYREASSHIFVFLCTCCPFLTSWLESQLD